VGFVVRIGKLKSHIPELPHFHTLMLNKTVKNANLLQQGNFIDVSLAPHVSGSYAHHQEH